MKNAMNPHLRLHPMRRACVALAAALLASLACAGTTALATSDQMLFARVGADAGLSQGSVTAIQQDAAGFMWIGTEDGLNRYDGYEMRHIVRDRKNPHSLPNNWISALARDASGRLYVGTDGGGVSSLDPATGAFVPVTGANGRALLDPQARVRGLMFDRKGRLWVGTRGSGVSVVDLAAGETRQFRRDLTNPRSLSDDAVYDIVEDGDGAIWVASEAGLDRIDPNTDSVEQWSDRLHELQPTGANRRVSALLVDERGILWAATGSGLARLDPATGNLAVLRHAVGDRNSLPDDRVTALLQDGEQRMWVGTTGGLALLDRRAEKFSVFRHDPGDASSLPDDYITSLFEDAGGLLWIGTKSGGLARWNPRSWSFGHRRLGEGTANNVTSFAEDRQGVLWIGSFGAGLTAIRRADGTAIRYGAGTGGATDIGDDNVMAVVVDARDRVWAGTMMGGISRIDTRAQRIDRFTHRADDPKSLSAPGVMALAEDSRGNIWVGTYGGGIARIDGTTDAVTRFPIARPGQDGLSNDRATTIAEDHAGLIWIGTDGGGLNVLDPASGRFRHFRHDPNDARSLSSDTVYDVHVDEVGQVWVGTRGGGLDRAVGAPLSESGLRFENFSEIDGLPNSTVYGIESNGRDRLWLSTNRGLSRFEVKARRFVNFRRSHGLQGDEFNFGAHYAAPSGELFFGGANGYNAFFSDRLQLNANAPKVVVTDVLKLGAPAMLGVPPEIVRSLKLGYRDDVLTFRFAGLDFAAPGENHYSYMLEGFDSAWVAAGTQRQATYTDLDGGNYVFRVRAANSDGVWNEAGIAVALTVDPPPWLTWWAYSLYGLLLALLLGAVWLSQQRKVEREAAYKRRLEQEVEERTTELNLRNTQLEDANRQLRDASFTDPLTGLGNRYTRRALYDAVGKLIEESRNASPGGRPMFAVMMVDLDRLKPINDQHGHEAGDRVLVQVAEILRHVSRTTDKVVRWGGDEFLLVCQGADMAAATDLAERIRAAVTKQIFRVGDGVAARTSCSIGFAVYPFVPQHPDFGNWEGSLAMADAALYQAKRLRNSWVGWCGTSRALQLPSLLDSVERDALALEEGGYLDVRRPAANHNDTVDRLRALQGPQDR